jgi:RimJ/RimL family protein N-acetyltransferase
MASVIRLTARVSAALIRTQEVLFFRSEGSVESPAPNVVELTRVDLERIKSDPRRPWARELGEGSWFEDGGRLYALELDGNYVSFGWAKTADRFQVGEIRAIVHLTSNVQWIWSCFTPPEHRGNGYYPALLIGIRHALPSEQTVIYCVRENRASRRGIMRAGFRDAFSIIRHRFFVICRNTEGGLYAGYERV